MGRTIVEEKKYKASALASTWKAWLNENKHEPEVRTVLLFDAGTYGATVRRLRGWIETRTKDPETLERYIEALVVVRGMYIEESSAETRYRPPVDAVEVGDGCYRKAEHIYGDDWNEVAV
jgi:hypothetical protein